MTNAGPEIGDLAPEFDALDLNGQVINFAGIRDKLALLVFIGTKCPACAELLPSLKSILRSDHKTLDILLVSLDVDGDEAQRRDFVTQHKISEMTYVSSPELALKYSVPTTPYAVLIDKEGKVRAKGIVNNIEHLESLLNAEESGHASIESLKQAGSTKRETAEVLGTQVS